MKCPACGFETQTEVNFCPSCGGKMPVAGGQPAAPAQEAAPPPATEQPPQPEPTAAPVPAAPPAPQPVSYAPPAQPPAPAAYAPPAPPQAPAPYAPPPAQTPAPAAPPPTAPPAAGPGPYVPAATPAPAPPKKKSACWWWGCGGCGCLALIALGIGIAIALSPSFKKGFEKSFKASVGTSTEEPTTKEETGTTSEGATASDVTVEAMRVGDVYDADSEKVTSEKSEFAPDTPEIHVDADLKGLTTGSKIKGTLIAVSVMDGEGHLIQNKEVASYEVVAPGTEAGVHFKFSAPTKGWPTGEYVIELSVDGQKVQEAEFMVKGEGEGNG
jgi:hypothetical protein